MSEEEQPQHAEIHEPATEVVVDVQEDNSGIDNDDDDDFDDFNEAGNDNDDDDFGDFDNTSYVQSTHPSFPEDVLNDSQQFIENLNKLMDSIFPSSDSEPRPTPNADENNNTSSPLLNERAATIFQQVSTLPYLHPTSWTKSNIRHSLLVQLGIPINLDELAQPPHASSTLSNLTRRKSITSASDIDWTVFDIPEFDKLDISSEQESRLLESTFDTLAMIEYDNLANCSSGYLEAASIEAVDEKLHQLESHYDELIKLSSCWQHRMAELHSDFEIYEGVVQSFIGYSQKLRRQEILEENLKKVKHTSTKKKFWK
ncbi:uncharacterized protein SPAPADRAFT_137494 [Spathaspora passalidarum NRRL Y-27907]|uniref:Uncharacterized protein n=1 Tax=Spathaspora passalidarum (strain NRRL Y-27907 / 11-Y1) TaxID=619300 RepID=G3ALL2_SPAPN|nr:uncharacterized protein SPAPADRAFT_137494 [Spathaspora passalidarum NRRL Y-27907]EGW33255.1 hypothetical protein SPAPADRAFT_137494 [Spathaspora passalidarum NRRL Y-27907]